MREPAWIALGWLLISGQMAHAAPRLIAGVVRGFPGRTVEVPISLRYATNDLRDVVALQADVVFDGSGLSDGPILAGPLAAHHVLATSSPTFGTRRLLVYTMGNRVLTNGEIARIPFTVAPHAFRNFPLRLENVILVRENASQVFSLAANGAVAVSEVFLREDGQADGFLNVATNDTEQCFIVQATTDFRAWAPVQTNTTDGALLQFVDAQAGLHPFRFYRAIRCGEAAGAPPDVIPLQIARIAQLPGNRLQFDFTGLMGRSFVIQTSTNLTDWSNLQTNVGLGGPITVIDGLTNHAHRFYRVRRDN